MRRVFLVGMFLLGVTSEAPRATGDCACNAGTALDLNVVWGTGLGGVAVLSLKSLWQYLWSDDGRRWLMRTFFRVKDLCGQVSRQEHAIHSFLPPDDLPFPLHHFVTSLLYRHIIFHQGPYLYDPFTQSLKLIIESEAAGGVSFFGLYRSPYRVIPPENLVKIEGQGLADVVNYIQTMMDMLILPLEASRHRKDLMGWLTDGHIAYLNSYPQSHGLEEPPHALASRPIFNPIGERHRVVAFGELTQSGAMKAPLVMVHITTDDALPQGNDRRAAGLLFLKAPPVDSSVASFYATGEPLLRTSVFQTDSSLRPSVSQQTDPVIGEFATDSPV